MACKLFPVSGLQLPVILLDKNAKLQGPHMQAKQSAIRRRCIVAVLLLFCPLSHLGSDGALDMVQPLGSLRDSGRGRSLRQQPPPEHQRCLRRRCHTGQAAAPSRDLPKARRAAYHHRWQSPLLLLLLLLPSFACARQNLSPPSSTRAPLPSWPAPSFFLKKRS